MSMSPFRERIAKTKFRELVDLTSGIFEDTTIPVEIRHGMFKDLEHWMTETAFPSLKAEAQKQAAAEALERKLAWQRKLALEALEPLDVTWKGSRAFAGTFVRGFQAALAGKQLSDNKYVHSCNKGFATAWEMGLKAGRQWLTVPAKVDTWVLMKCRDALSSPDKDGNIKCPFTLEEVKHHQVRTNCPNCYSQGNVKDCLNRMVETLDEQDTKAT